MKYFTRALTTPGLWILCAFFLCTQVEIIAQVSITCPGNIVQGNNPGLCGATVNYTTPVGTGSGTGIATTLTGGIAPGQNFPVGVTFVQYTVTNNEGDNASCSFFVSVNDTEDPVLDCPDDITVDADPSSCSAIATFDFPTATDNCAVIDIQQIGGLPSGSSFPIGENSVDFEAYDSEGNAGFCRLKIFVIDVTDPTITCPSDIFVDVISACSAVVNYTPPVGADECSISNTVLTSGLGSGASFPVGTTTETYTVTDLGGNATLCSFDVTVTDVAPPVITCLADIAVNATPGSCDAIVNFADPGATDNCPGTVVTQTGGPVSGSAFPTGVTEIEFTATDASGNGAACTFTVSVIENNPPVIACPADISVSTDPDACTAMVTYTAPVGTDDCEGANTVLTSGLGSGAAFPVGITTEVYTVTDASGNETSCSFDITVEDNEDPAIDCPVSFLWPTSPGRCDGLVIFDIPDVTDNCPGATITQTGGFPPNTFFPIGTTTVEYTAEDASGNITICSFDVTVNDAQDPVITCPADFTVTTAGDDCDVIVVYADPVATDNCPGVNTTLISGPASGDLLTTGIYTVTFEAEDAAGNTSTCSFDITVEEANDPTIACSGNITASAATGTCEAVVTFPTPTGTDPCSDVTVTQTGGPLSGSSFPLGSTTVEFTAEDEFGNTDVCTFDIVITDDEDPVFTCPGDLTVSTDPGACDAAVTFALPVATDNCDSDVTVVQSGGPASGSTFPIGTTSIEFTATDDSGNASICTYDIIVEDQEDPEITCPVDINLIIPDGDCDVTLTYADPLASDNCPGVTFALTSGPASGSTLPEGTYEIEYTATDAAGNESICTFQAIVTEDTPPVFICPADVTVPTDAGVCEAVVNFSNPTATDACSDVTVTQTDGPLSGSVFPIGSTAVEFTAEDESGNTAICTFNIIVEDMEAPDFDCPSDILVDMDAGACDAAVTFSPPTATDNCDATPVITQTGGPASGSTFPAGNTAIEFTATDADGNASVCTFDVVVSDQENPTIICPADLNLTIPMGDCEIELTYGVPLADDNCPGVSFAVTDGPLSGSILESGTYNITYTATDAAGNTETCTFQALINEATPPVFICPADINAIADAGACEAVVTFDPPIATDDCSDVTVTQTGGPASGSSFPVGTTSVEFTAEDESGNTTICTFDVIVVDQDDPIIVCPSNIVVDNDLSFCGAVVTYAVPVGTDDCGSTTVVLTSGLGTGSFFPVGTHTETYEVTDLSGNTATCSFDITVQDIEGPVIDCADDILIENIPDGDCEAIVFYALPNATDNCGVASINLVEGLPSGASFPVGTTIITYQAIDDSGNTAECSFAVNILENVPPEITCPSDIIVDNDPDICGAVVTYTAPEGTDNCGNAITGLTAGLGSGATFPVGTTIEEYTVTDLSGNETTCSFQVIVNDVSPPVITCPESITVPADGGTCEAIVTFDAPLVTDNCDDDLIAVQTAGPVSGSAFPAGTTEVTFQVSDLSGNTATCSFNVLVLDDTDPVINCPANIVFNAADGDCEAIVTYPVVTATDNCTTPLVTLISGPASGSTFPVGVTTITYQAEDESGNTASCSFTVTVLEFVPPTITCPDDISVVNDAGACDAVVNYDAPIATDGCGDVTVSLIAGLPSGSAFPVGTTTVTYEATDGSGNTTTCSFDVVVADEEAPVFDCPDNVNISTDAGLCAAVYNFTPPSATDNCDGAITVTQTEGPDSGTQLAPGSTTFAFTATDPAGNTVTCSYDVVVTDTESPVFTTCPDDFNIAITADCTVEIQFDTPTATDNCTVTLTQTAGPLNGESVGPGVYSITYSAEDPAGNTSECNFEITVTDDIQPVFTECPAEIETCDPVVTFDTPVAADNCDDVVISQTAGPVSGSIFPEGITTVTFEATDNSGNSATCSFDVVILPGGTRPDAGEDQNICDETSTTLTGNTPDFGTGVWSLISGNGNIQNPGAPETDVDGLTEGANVFIWTIDPDNGCALLSDTVTIRVEPGVTVDAGSDQNIQLGNQAGLNASFTPAGGDIVWQPAATLSCETCDNPLANPIVSTTYYAIYTSPLGCERIDSVTVQVSRELPNTITPNNDGVNDVWNIPGIADYPNVEVYIYNRWGNEIFRSTGYREPWDGKRGGDDLPTGAYFYMIDYKSSGVENLNGTVNIIR